MFNLYIGDGMDNIIAILFVACYFALFFPANQFYFIAYVLMPVYMDIDVLKRSKGIASERFLFIGQCVLLQNNRFLFI